MKIISKSSLVAIIIVVISFSFVSCEKTDYSDTQLMNASDLEATTNDLNTSQSDGLLKARNESDEWDEVNYPYPYIPGKNYKFSTNSAVALSGFDFKFGVRVRNLNGIMVDYPEIYLKTYSPTGKIEYIKMWRSGDRYYLYQSFDENGTYYYRYFAKHPYPYMGNTLISISESNSFDVTIPVPSLPFTITNNPQWNYGEVLGTVNGVEVHCNTNIYVTPHKLNYSVHEDSEWQCVEFCKRYYDEIYDHDVSGIGPHVASEWYDNATNVGLNRYSNGGSIAPRPGDILCYGGGASLKIGGTWYRAGHVAIIIEVQSDHIKIAQQNTGTSGGVWAPIGAVLQIITAPSGYTIQGWLRIP